jgi:hypothetical protein
LSSSGDTAELVAEESDAVASPRDAEKIATAVVKALVPAWVFAIASFAELRAFIWRTINYWVVDRIIRPIIEAVLGLGALLADGILFVAFGEGRAIGGPRGLVDASVWVVSTVVDELTPIGAALVGVVDSFNQSLAVIASDAGLAAPPVVALLWVAEGAVVGYILWTAVRVINVPAVDLDAIILRATYPFRWLLGRTS